MPKKKPSDRYLSEVSTRVANGIRNVIVAEFEQMVADGYDPYYVRYGILTAHLLTMADIIGASGDPIDREEMKIFLQTSGAGIIDKYVEAVIEGVAIMERQMH